MDEKAAFSARLKKAMIAAGYEPRPAVLEKQFNSRYWGKSLTLQAVSRWLNGQAQIFCNSFGNASYSKTRLSLQHAMVP